MLIRYLSLKNLAVGLLLMSTLVSLTLLFTTASYFRAAALQSQSQSLSRVLHVATKEVVKKLHEQLFEQGMTVQSRKAVRDALRANLGESARLGLIQELDEPIGKGFVGSEETELTRLRAYDLNLTPLAQSSLGLDFEPGLPPELKPLLADRRGAERFKAVGGFWKSTNGTMYSVIIPIGGLQVLGYLEVVANPGSSFPAIGAMTRMPLEIHDASGVLVFQSVPRLDERDPAFLPVVYNVTTATGSPAYRIVGLENVTKLNAELDKTIIVGFFIFCMFGGSGVWLGMLVLQRFVFAPVRELQLEMDRSANGDLAVTVETPTLREFRVLAVSFNTMARKVESSIQELQRLSSIDGLTGVHNRRQMDITLVAECKRAKRTGEPLALVMLDIDFFKQYNDTYGHLGGDDCLRAVGKLLGTVVQRPTDTVARYGGEEFALLLPDTPLHGAEFLALKIAAELNKLSIPHTASPLGGRITVSMGCAMYDPESAVQPDDLIAAADAALFRAKKAGRNRVELAYTVTAVHKV